VSGKSVEGRFDEVSEMGFCLMELLNLSRVFIQVAFCGCCGLALWVEKGKWISLKWLMKNLKSLFL
jgi:hypothetical protein